MKNSVFISIFILSAFGVFSCTTNKTTAAEHETTVAQEIPATVEVVQESTVDASLPIVSQAWEDGTIEITGKISNVKQEKDGQTITLKGNNGITYTAVISIPNLGENHAQYRKFTVGENASFRAEIAEDNSGIIKEVLKTR